MTDNRWWLAKEERDPFEEYDPRLPYILPPRQELPPVKDDEPDPYDGPPADYEDDEHGKALPY